jgi:hypothetical protein
MEQLASTQPAVLLASEGAMKILREQVSTANGVRIVERCLDMGTTTQELRERGIVAALLGALQGEVVPPRWIYPVNDLLPPQRCSEYLRSAIRCVGKLVARPDVAVASQLLCSAPFAEAIVRFLRCADTEFAFQVYEAMKPMMESEIGAPVFIDSDCIGALCELAMGKRKRICNTDQFCFVNSTIFDDISNRFECTEMCESTVQINQQSVLSRTRSICLVGDADARSKHCIQASGYCDANLLCTTGTLQTGGGASGRFRFPVRVDPSSEIW